jgi:hypothetical protein
MVEATLSHVRVRRPAQSGPRIGPDVATPQASPRRAWCASRRQPVTDAASIADGLPSRPEAAGRRPEHE